MAICQAAAGLLVLYQWTWPTSISLLTAARMTFPITTQPADRSAWRWSSMRWGFLTQEFPVHISTAVTSWSLESILPRSVRTTLAQLRSGHCQLLKSYMVRITTGVSDVCPECGVAPHSVEHLFNCSAHPTQLTVQDLWVNPVEVADFLNVDSWRQWTRREELLGYHNNNNFVEFCHTARQHTVLNTIHSLMSVCEPVWLHGCDLH